MISVHFPGAAKARSASDRPHEQTAKQFVNGVLNRQKFVFGGDMEIRYSANQRDVKRYTTEEALQAAADSYGGLTEAPYLSPE